MAKAESLLDTTFDEREAEILAKRWRLFAPITAVLLFLSEALAYVTPEFPKSPLLVAVMIAAMGAMYWLARSNPRRPVIGWATVAAGIAGGAFVATPCALTDHFMSPHVLAMPVVFALVPGVLSLKRSEATVLLVVGMTAWVAVNFALPADPVPTHGLTTVLIYFFFLALVTLLSVARNRELREGEFQARQQLERMHRFTVEEVLNRHLPPAYVAQVLSGARTVDQPPERRTVTIVFSDIAGFTQFTEAVTPDVLSDFMAQFYDLVSNVAIHYGGTLDKFIGDAAMVLFGAPNDMPLEEQARSAVQMATTWHRQIERIAPPGQRLAMRVGIHQEQVIVGSFGGKIRTDYTAFGNGVNIAARLERSCPTGRILISKSVQQHLDPQYPIEPQGRTALRGMSELIETFQINPNS